MLGTVFILLAALALLASLACLWQSLRAAFGASEEHGFAASTGSVERVSLLDEKAQLVTNIQDLKFDHEIGKISDKDYQKLNKEMRARAVQVLKLLDQDVAPYRREAERLIDKRLAKIRGRSPYRDRMSDPDLDEELHQPVAPRDGLRCPKCTTVNDADADWCKSCRARLTDQHCAECGTRNDADATFCKKCATELEQAPSESAETKAKESSKKKSTGKSAKKKSTKKSAKKKSGKADMGSDEGAAEAVADSGDAGADEPAHDGGDDPADGDVPDQTKQKAEGPNEEDA